MKLTIVTWSMRHANLGRMAIQMGALSEAVVGLKICWHVAFNPLNLNYSYDTLRVNGLMVTVDELLCGVLDGWILIVSDDNLLHPRLPSRLVELVKEHPEAKAFHVRSTYKGGERPALPDHLTFGKVDGGQIVIDAEYFRSFNWKYWEFGSEQEGGLFRRMKENSVAGSWVHVDEVLSYHDAQR